MNRLTSTSPFFGLDFIFLALHVLTSYEISRLFKCKLPACLVYLTKWERTKIERFRTKSHKFVHLKETEYLLLSHFCLDCIIAKSERKYCQSTLHKSVTFLFAMESCKELESYFSSIYFTTLCMSCGMM